MPSRRTVPNELDIAPRDVLSHRPRLPPPTRFGEAGSLTLEKVYSKSNHKNADCTSADPQFGAICQYTTLHPP